MPIYEYVCTDCGAQIEVIQRFSDPPLEECQSCSGRLQKKISPAAFHLKGSGWYITDYARKSSGSNGESQNDKSGTGEKSDGGTAAEKPAKEPSTTTETTTGE